MALQVYINGTFKDKSEASISVFDHGLLYGDGVFEGIRAYSGDIFRCEEHIQRLYDSAKAIALDIPMSQDEMIHAIQKTLDINELTNAYIRVIVTRGIGSLGLDPTKCDNPQIIIITDEIALYPPEFYKKGLEVITVPTVRNNHNALSPKIKSLNYLNNTLAKIEGLQAGVIEAIMLNNQGYVAECTGDNIFIVSDETLFTPPPEAGILEGITRQVVMDIARKLGFEVREQNLTRFDLYVADEAFLTGTAAELVPVVRIDSRDVGEGEPGPITHKLLDEFRQLTGSE
ncbi:MAG: branched-chain-amino-acid transaminase [Planctomycetota bacterium]